MLLRPWKKAGPRLVVNCLIIEKEVLFYSRKKQSADLFFYVTEKGTGHGANLMRRFITWSKKNNGVKEIALGVSSGIGDSDRVKQLYERMGATRVGDNFVVS